MLQVLWSKRRKGEFFYSMISLVNVVYNIYPYCFNIQHMMCKPNEPHAFLDLKEKGLSVFLLKGEWHHLMDATIPPEIKQN